MDSTRAICDREISTNDQKMDSLTASFRLSMEPIKAKAQQTVQNQVKLMKMKADLRQAEDELVKVLADTKVAKQMAIRDSLSVTKARLEELKRDVEVQRARRVEYSAVISQQSLAMSTSAEKTKQESNRKGQIQEAISWYNRVLGLHVEGGHGVRFTFSSINMKIPNGEYYFTIHRADDSYTLLHCNPPLNNTEELIQELNRINGLFKFVRIMRDKFEQAAVLEILKGLGKPRPMRGFGNSFQPAIDAPRLEPHELRHCPKRKDFLDYRHSWQLFTKILAVSLCLLFPCWLQLKKSDSPRKTNKYQIQRGEGYRQQVNEMFQRSESIKKNQHQIQHGEGNRQSKKANHGRTSLALSSPGSASTPRRSMRIKGKT